VTGSDFTTTSLSAVNITGLTFAAAANKVYEFDIMLLVSSSTNAGIKANVSYSGTFGSNSYRIMYANTAQTSTLSIDGDTFNSVDNTARVTQTNVGNMYLLHGFVSTTGTGNITAQILKVTSGTATVYIGSRMTVTLLA